MIITSYYNPAQYKSRAENYKRFIEEIGVPVLTMETAYGDEPFTLKNSVKLRAENPTWHKENLLILGEKLLPKDQDYVIWADCDILFENKNWFEDTKKLLKEYKVVQPYEMVNRLDKEGKIEFSWTSFGREYSKGVESDKFNEHGHTGFAMSCRRENFSLYPYCIAGGFDHVYCHAVGAKQIPHKCIDRAFYGQNIEHLYNWAIPYNLEINGSMHYTEGKIDHLYHGKFENRQYFTRVTELSELRFDPETDIVFNKDGLMQITRPDIQEWTQKFFRNRLEDE